MTQKISLALTVVILALGGVVGYRLVKADITTEAYRQKLVALADDFEELRGEYNTAITRTAVTELLVTNGQVCVVVRTVDGKERVIPTPYTTKTQVYVEYMVIDGRLWIRRVFDDQTAPQLGVVVDPQLAEIDWDSPKVVVSKAISRKLSEGRWVITVTGDGSLGLAKTDRPQPLELNPTIREFEPREQPANTQVDRISPAEVIRRGVTGE